MPRRRLVRPRGERLGLGTNGCAIVVHGANGLACALEVAEHLCLREVRVVDGVRVDRVLQVTTLTAATSDRHFMNDCVRLPCTKGGTGRLSGRRHWDPVPLQSPTRRVRSFSLMHSS